MLLMYKTQIIIPLLIVEILLRGYMCSVDCLSNAEIETFNSASKEVFVFVFIFVWLLMGKRRGMQSSTEYLVCIPLNALWCSSVLYENVTFFTWIIIKVKTKTLNLSIFNLSSNLISSGFDSVMLLCMNTILPFYILSLILLT